MIKLVKVSREYKEQYEDMMREWRKTSEKIYPYSIRREFSCFEDAIKTFENDSKGINIGSSVPSTTYLAYDDEKDIVVGAVNIKHYLNDELSKYGGHIADGVRPSQRRNGYATEMIRQALEVCRNELKLEKVLMVCNKNNIGSAKSIMKNGGVFESDVYTDDNELVSRYWIYL